jgi:hypothetical protein
MTHKIHSLSLLLFLLAFKTSFVSAASSEECPPNAKSGSLCQQFKIAAWVAPNTTVTGPTYLELKRVGDHIEGETSAFTITTNENIKYIAIEWGPSFSSLSGGVGLINRTNPSGDESCKRTASRADGFPLDFHFKYNGGDYSVRIEDPYGGARRGMRIPMEQGATTATFNLKFRSTHAFSDDLQQLEDGATYGCNFQLKIAPGS